jgi:hypothetical protein
MAHAMAQLVKALHYKTEDCWFDSGRSLFQGSTQPLIEMNTRVYLLGGKGGWRVGLTTFPAAYANFIEIWEARPSGTLGICSGSSTRIAATVLCSYQKQYDNFQYCIGGYNFYVLS